VGEIMHGVSKIRRSSKDASEEVEVEVLSRVRAEERQVATEVRPD